MSIIMYGYNGSNAKKIGSLIYCNNVWFCFMTFLFSSFLYYESALELDPPSYVRLLCNLRVSLCLSLIVLQDKLMLSLPLDSSDCGLFWAENGAWTARQREREAENGAWTARQREREEIKTTTTKRVCHPYKLFTLPKFNLCLFYYFFFLLFFKWWGKGFCSFTPPSLKPGFNHDKSSPQNLIQPNLNTQILFIAVFEILNSKFSPLNVEVFEI